MAYFPIAITKNYNFFYISNSSLAKYLHLLPCSLKQISDNPNLLFLFGPLTFCLSLSVSFSWLFLPPPLSLPSEWGWIASRETDNGELWLIWLDRDAWGLCVSALHCVCCVAVCVLEKVREILIICFLFGIDHGVLCKSVAYVDKSVCVSHRNAVYYLSSPKVFGGG